MIIEVRDLVKRYKKADRNAVDGVSFDVPKGGFYALLGPNGAGKTTTVSILTTTLSKTAGQVKIAGFDIDSQASQIRKNIGIIFQSPSLDINLTAEENVRLHASLYGLYSFRPIYSAMADDYKKQVGQLADILGIKNDIFKSIKTYSGGMKRKLEILRSLIHHPQVLFLDEPTTGLDPESRRNLWQYIIQIREKEKTTIFLTTHYLEEAEQADYVCIINHGQMISCGTPQQIKKDLVDEYLVLDAQDRPQLKKKLASLNLEIIDGPPFKVYKGQMRAQEIIQSIDLPLTVLKIHSPTLEEAYLKIISQDNHARA